MSDLRKQSVYFPENTLNAMRARAAKENRSLSQVMQRAWDAHDTGPAGWAMGITLGVVGAAAVYALFAKKPAP